jgi:sugar phosphate isomerase/epimerase
LNNLCQERRRSLQLLSLRFDLSGHAPFHAWVELAGLVVNDHAELQSGYRVIQRLPLQDILGVVRATGWDGVLSVELFREEYWWLDPLTVAREAKARTIAVWERVLQHDGR